MENDEGGQVLVVRDNHAQTAALRCQGASVLQQHLIWGVIMIVLLSHRLSAWGASTSREQSIEEECLRLQNEFRKRHGRAPLEFDADLRTMARKHSQDMLRRDYFSHTSPEGEGATERKNRYCPRLLGGIGENIFTLSGSVAKKLETEIAALIIRGWEESPGHRANMLNADFTHAAVGVASSGDRLMATANFSHEFALLDNALPTTAAAGSRLVVTGEVRGRLSLGLLDAFLCIPDANASCRVPDRPNAYSVGGCFLKVQHLSDTRFQVVIELCHGKGVYEFQLGKREQGRSSFYPGWKLEAQ